MRAFLSYSVAADILISGFEHGMHIYLRMVDFSLFMCSFPSISTFLHFIYSLFRLIEDF